MRHRIVSGVITNGTDRILMHGVYADPNDRGRINEEIEREVLRRITARVHSSQLVAGDFQGPISEGTLGSFLLQAGWCFFTQCWEGEPETNRPPHGRARALDELAVCPSLRNQLREARKEWPEGFSTHAYISVIVDHADRTIEGMKQKCTYTKGQLEE